MKRPLMTAAVLVLCGTICGIRETSVLLKTAAMMLMAALFLQTGRQYEGSLRKLILPVMAVLTLASGARGAYAARQYARPECRAFFEKYQATNPGQFDYALYLKGQGISSEEQYLAWKEGTGTDAAPLMHALESVRDQAAAVYDDRTTVHDAGLFRAIILGDKSGLDDAAQNLYQSAGIAHLLAVSGLHVSLLGAGLYSLLRRRKIRRSIAGALSGIWVLCYMLLTGASGSTVRAAVMLLVLLAADSMGRVYDMQSAMALAMILAVLDKPYQIFQSGFQLSYGAVASICLVSGNLIGGLEHSRQLRRTSQGRTSKRVRKSAKLHSFTTMLLTGISIQLTMLPIIAWHYFVFPTYAVLLNLIVIPLMTAVVGSGLAVLAAGMAGSAVSLRFFNVLAAGAAAPGHYVLKLYELLCAKSLSLPFSTVCIGRPALWQILLYYSVLAGMLYLLQCEKGIFHTDIHDVRNNVGRTPVVLLLLVLNTFNLRHVRTSGLTITAIDVGQGDGFLIETRERTILIDGGSGSNRLLGERILQPLLLSKGITCLDACFISHADLDHVSGIGYLIQSDIRIDAVYLPAPAAISDRYDEFMGLAVSRTACLSEGDTFSLSGASGLIKALLQGPDSVNLTCIYAGNVDWPEEVNRHSSVLLLSYGNFSMLFTGDLTAEDEEEVGRLLTAVTGSGRLTVLKAAHHGSATSTSEAFLDVVHPRYAVVSAGRNNRYGHPAAEVMERLWDHGVLTMETSKTGAIEIMIRHGHMVIRGFRQDLGTLEIGDKANDTRL